MLPCKLWRLLHIQKWLFMKTTCEDEDEDEGGILWKAKAQHGPMVHELSSINLKVFQSGSSSNVHHFPFAQGNEIRVY